MNKPKPPIKPGIRVKKRGFDSLGTVLKISGLDEDGCIWVSIKWDEGVAPRVRPFMCDAAELETV